MASWTAQRRQEPVTERVAEDTEGLWLNVRSYRDEGAALRQREPELHILRVAHGPHRHGARSRQSRRFGTLARMGLKRDLWSRRRRVRLPFVTGPLMHGSGGSRRCQPAPEFQAVSTAAASEALRDRLMWLAGLPSPCLCLQPELALYLFLACVGFCGRHRLLTCFEFRDNVVNG